MLTYVSAVRLSWKLQLDYTSHQLTITLNTATDHLIGSVITDWVPNVSLFWFSLSI